jgi:hypothetical protein
MRSSENPVNSYQNTRHHISEEIIFIVTAVIALNHIHNLRLIKQNDYSVDELDSIPHRGQGLFTTVFIPALKLNGPPGQWIWESKTDGA